MRCCSGQTMLPVDAELPLTRCLMLCIGPREKCRPRPGRRGEGTFNETTKADGQARHFVLAVCSAFFALRTVQDQRNVPVAR